MKHFHLSQGDKLAGLDGPLYLQKKIKSVLTLAPFIGNTCLLVIVLNSILSRAAPHWVALAISHWLGMAVEFARISSQIQGLCEGTFLGQAGRRGLFGFHASWRKTLSPYCQRAPPSAPCPWFLSEIGKDQRALTEPKGLPSCLGAWESLQKEK